RRHTRSKRDWSSDVCSSDLRRRRLPDHGTLPTCSPFRDFPITCCILPARSDVSTQESSMSHGLGLEELADPSGEQRGVNKRISAIGRASCREGENLVVRERE